MKRLVSTIIFCFLLTSLFGYSLGEDKNEEKMIRSFKELIINAVTLVNSTVEVERYSSSFPTQHLRGKWHKQLYKIWDISFDIQKTSSLIFPYKGIVTGKGKGVILAPFNSMQEAEAAFIDDSMTFESYPHPKDKYPLNGYAEFRLIYGYQNGMWLLKNGSYQYKGISGAIYSIEPLWDPRHGGIKDRSFGMIYEYWAPTPH
jgi:hypothetical protein